MVKTGTISVFRSTNLDGSRGDQDKCFHDRVHSSEVEVVAGSRSFRHFSTSHPTMKCIKTMATFAVLFVLALSVQPACAAELTADGRIRKQHPAKSVAQVIREIQERLAQKTEL